MYHARLIDATVMNFGIYSGQNWGKMKGDGTTIYITSEYHVASSGGTMYVDSSYALQVAAQSGSDLLATREQ